MNLIDAMEINPVLQEKSKHLWNRALAGEQFTAHENFVDTSNQTNYFEVTYNPIRNKEDKIIGASHIIRNTTDRKLAEDSLKRDRDFISAIVEASNLLVMVVDIEGKIVKFNRACEEASGYKLAEVDGRVFWNILIPPEEAANVKLNHRKIKLRSSTENFVNHWVTKDEKMRLISWRHSLIKDADGVEFLIATGIDITEKAEFKETQNRILDILETSSDFIGISDIAGKIRYLNRAGKEILGTQESEDLSQRKMISCYPNWAGDLVQSEGIPTAMKHGSWIGETALITSSGREFPVSQLILAHRNSKDEIEYLSTVARDISKQKRLENELAKTRDKAIETAKIKSEFLANMSHEIRTPMNGIIGLAELLLSTELTKEQADYAESVQHSGEILLTIVNDILDFSKIEAGKFHLETLNFDLRDTAESVLELFAEPAYRKEIEMSLLVHQDVPNDLQGDPRRLRQILTNLISNAIKFTEKGEITIRVKLKNKEQDKTTLHFSVSDTGIGVNKKAQKDLFEAFTQANSSITRQYGGTGLGLTISKQLVELMDGEIGIKSQEGKGAEFWFTTNFEATENNYYPNISENLKNSRVLIVDDNDSFRRILMSQIKGVGIFVEEANSSKTALNLLKTAAKNKEPFKTVIVDLNMTEINGMELSQLIKKERSIQNTPILLMPSINDHGVIKKVKEKGADSYIFKPIRQTELYEKLSHLLNKKEGNTEKTKERETVSQELLSEPISIGESFLEKNHVPDTHGPRILIAEDNRVNQKVLSVQLKNLGYKSDIKSNGEEVLEAIRDQTYSMILMDCQMPILDGFEASMKIRENEEGSDVHIPIIAITANVLEGDQERCLAAGMDDYIRKPIKQDDLAQIVGKWAGLNQIPQIEPDSNDQTEETESQSIQKRLDSLTDACDHKLTFECLEVFIEDVDISVSKLIKALEANDAEGIEHEAHKLKGSAANMGAVKLPEVCRILLELIHNGEVKKCHQYLNNISEEYELLKPIYRDQKRLYEEIVNDMQPVK